MIRFLALIAYLLSFQAVTAIYSDVAAQAIISGNPTNHTRISDTYRIRERHPVTGAPNSVHRGIDYAAPTGTAIRSTMSGTVTYSGSMSGYGNTIIVTSHSGNVQTLYAHNSSNSVRYGDTVTQGQTIGAVGSTGRSTGPHLHYETRVMDRNGNPVAVNPALVEQAIAQGKDLNDPAVRDELIAESNEQLDGQLKSSTNPQGETQTAAEAAASASEQAGDIIGCDPAILNHAETKVQALKQQETEAAKALITKPASVQQLTCFDQYTKINAEKIGRIHSDPPKGISDTIAPNVELPNMQSVIQNFMTGVLGGGLQSMLNNALGSLTGGLLGGGGAAGGCNAMGEMWNLLQCIDFPQMPSLSDILGGGGGDLGGILSGLGGAGGLGSLGGGGGGGGIMGAVCQAMKGAMGGGGSGGTSVYEDLLNQNSQDVEGNGSIYDEDTVGRLLEDIQDTVSGTNLCTANTWVYPTQSLSRIDVLIPNNEVDASEFTLFDTNGDCEITEAEIVAYEGNDG